MPEHVQVAIIGAGAAGLMAAIFAARNATSGARIVALDGAEKLGAKILVAGGGRCNVTHDEVSAEVYAGGSRNAIRKVLKRFDVPQTVAFFEEIGVPLKREPTGKLFPTTDKARTVLDALLNAATGAELRHPARVDKLSKCEGKCGGGFELSGTWGTLTADRVILATGGRSLPKTGSDGGGYRLAQGLGHTLTEPTFPALVPLLLPAGHYLTALSGIAIEAELTLVSGTGRALVSFTNSVLFTHFGLSGPGALDMSRYYIEAKRSDPGAALHINFLPRRGAALEPELITLGTATLLRYLAGSLPDRLARALCEQAGVPPTLTGDRLNKDKRRAFIQTLTASALPISGDRGFNYAEVTAGGVPLTEIYLERMESRVTPGLYLCGEICDVDGRIGGYNFQWAWASGYVAGLSAGVISQSTSNS